MPYQTFVICPVTGRAYVRIVAGAVLAGTPAQVYALLVTFASMFVGPLPKPPMPSTRYPHAEPPRVTGSACVPEEGEITEAPLVMLRLVLIIESASIYPDGPFVLTDTSWLVLDIRELVAGVILSVALLGAETVIYRTRPVAVVEYAPCPMMLTAAALNR